MRHLLAGLAIGLLAPIALTAGGARSDDTITSLPAGTTFQFHLTAPVSSDRSKRGDPFSFVMLEPVYAEGHEIVAAGAIGTGAIVVAGHAGNQGHEGDLTFELDSIPTSDGRTVAFDRQLFQINGRNRKAQSNVLQLVPYVGLGAMFIRGSEQRVEASRPIETILLRPAPITAVTVEPASPPPQASE